MVFKALHDLAAAYLHYLIMFSISVILSFCILISSGEHTQFVDFGTSVLTRPFCLESSSFSWPAPHHSHLGSNITLSEALPHSPLWKYYRHSPRSGTGLHCGHLFPTPGHVSHLKSATVRVFTPKKLANTTNDGSPTRQPVVEFLPAHQCPLLSPCLCTTHGFSHFLCSTHPSEIIFSMCYLFINSLFQI